MLLDRGLLLQFPTLITCLLALFTPGSVLPTIHNPVNNHPPTLRVDIIFNVGLYLLVLSRDGVGILVSVRHHLAGLVMLSYHSTIIPPSLRPSLVLAHVGR